MPTIKSSIKKNKKNYWEHLEDLRWLLIRIFLSVIIFSIIAFLNKNFVFNNIFLAPKESWFVTNHLLCVLSKILSAPALCINNTDIKIINIILSGQFYIHVLISLFCGLILASPYIIWDIWNFIKPALNKKEKTNSKGAVLICTMLFLIGILFSYFIIVPLTLNFLGNYHVSNLVENNISLSSYINTIVSVTLSVGFVFETPVLIFFLTKVGIITPQLMRKNRKIVFVILLIVSAIITPPDAFSQILVCIPLIILYEISINISKKVYRKLKNS